MKIMIGKFGKIDNGRKNMFKVIFMNLCADLMFVFISFEQHKREIRQKPLPFLDSTGLCRPGFQGGSNEHFSINYSSWTPARKIHRLLDCITALL